MRVVWGAIEFLRSPCVSIAWRHTTMHKDYRCRSAMAAALKVREIVDAKIREGYKPLPTGKRIIRRARAANSTPRP
jgi:hypothetical protein